LLSGAEEPERAEAGAECLWGAEDQEKAGGGSSLPSLRTGRWPDLDPPAIVPPASHQHPCPSTDGGTGARGELRAGPCPGEGLPRVRCC